jgi:hypothetical protein
MTGLILAGLGLAALLALLARTLPGRGGKPARASYRKQDFLFTTEERFFFKALKQAAGNRYEIFGRIPVADIVSPRSSDQRGPGEFQNIADRSFAFVLCHAQDLSVACAVELRDPALAGSKSGEPVDPLRSICESAGLPLVRFETGPLYEPGDIKAAIAEAVQKDPVFMMTEADGRREPRFSNLENLEL